MNRPLLALLVLLHALLPAVFAETVNAATYYVSSIGNNGNSGTTLEQAWATPGFGSR